MSKSEFDDELTIQPKSRGAGQRRAYQSPKILFREPLEAMAASCYTIGGKGTVASCPSGPLES